jgi:class 3 adenylate cyclase
MVIESLMIDICTEIIKEQKAIFNKGAAITVNNEIPDTTKIPIQNPTHWIRIPDIICVYVDMINSTKLSAVKYDQSTANVYQLFTGTAVRLFHEFESPYIDVNGDGVFALFNSYQPHVALAAAVTFKTFSEKEFVPMLKDIVPIDTGSHIGIDIKTLLVRKIGLKRKGERTDRQNEVWAGKTVNMSAKLAARAKHGELVVSDRFYDKLNCKKALYSCGCPNGDEKNLWEIVDLCDDDKFDFDKAYLLSIPVMT